MEVHFREETDMGGKLFEELLRDEGQGGEGVGGVGEDGEAQG